MALQTLDSVILVAYFAVLFAMGAFFSTRHRSTESYFLGGRSFKGWVIGLSLVGTSISSITFLAYPADAFKTTWIRFLPNFMLPVAVIVASYVFLPFFRRGATTTAYEYLEARFGASVRLYGAAAFIVAQIVRVSLILYLISLVLQEITGLDATTCILLAGGLVAIYTVIGGIEAVVWTDVMQTIILVLGGATCLYTIADALPGGLGQILDTGMADGKFSFAPMEDGVVQDVRHGFSLAEKTVTMMLLIGLTNWLTEYSSNQNTIQRFCASASDREARKAMLVCVCCSLPIWGFFMFLGTALYVFFQVIPSTDAADMLSGAAKAEEILPYYIIHYLPAGIVGLVLAAALAAAMSSLDSSINAVSTVAIVDIYRRHLRPDESERHYLQMARAAAGLVGCLMIAGAVYLINADTKTLQDTATILVSILGGGLLGIYLVGFVTRRGTERSVWCGIAGTLVFTSWTVLSDKGLLPDALVVPFDLYYTGLIGNVLMFALVYAISTVSDRHTTESVRHLTVWGRHT